MREQCREVHGCSPSVEVITEMIPEPKQWNSISSIHSLDIDVVLVKNKEGDKHPSDPNTGV